MSNVSAFIPPGERIYRRKRCLATGNEFIYPFGLDLL